MNIKINSLLIIFILFTAFPFIYFYILINNQIISLLSVQAIYPIIIISGLFLALYTEKNLRNKIGSDAKQNIFIFFVTFLCLYISFLLLLTWSRYANFVSESIDLVYFHQTIWQLSEFKVPYIWSLGQPSFAVWSQHFSPILIFLVPFFWISHSAGLLLMIQALAAISGAIPIYLIGKHFAKSRSLGLALAFAYVSFGGLQFGFAYGFHEILFFPTIFLWAYYFYLCKKIKLYLLFIFLSLLVKEEVAFIVIFWGIYLLIIKRDKLLGSITGVLGLIWYYICFQLVFPYFNKGQGFGYWGQYDSSDGQGPLGMIKFILFKPLTFLTTLVTPFVKVEMFLETFGQFAFLLFLFPPSLIIIFPSIMEKLLSSGIAQANGAHYSAAIAAVTVIATFEALPKIFQYKFIGRYIHNKPIFFTVIIFYFALFSNIFFGYNGYSVFPFVHNSLREKGLTAENSQLLSQIINQIPQDATVAAEYQIAPHLNKYYKHLTIWPGMTGTEDFVVIDTELLPVLGASGQDYNNAIAKMDENNNYVLAINNFGILVYRNKSYHLPGLQ